MADAGDDPEDPLLAAENPEGTEPAKPAKRKGKQKDQRGFVEKYGHLIDPEWWKGKFDEPGRGTSCASSGPWTSTVLRS